MRVTILGCGSSSGVPGVGLGWGKCDPDNPKNRRLRPSILVETEAERILVDTSPDLREQLLRANVSRLDAVVYTHPHADHLHGIDDLRGINRAMEAPLPVFADANTIEHIRTRFAYALEPLPASATVYYKPTLITHEITPGRSFSIGETEIQTVDQDHGYSRTIGFRFGPFAYSTDLVEISEAAFEMVAGVDTWIIGTFTDRPHLTHCHVDKVLAWIDRVQPRRTVLTHLGADLDYDDLSRRLPDKVIVAFDGMTLEAP